MLSSRSILHRGGSRGQWHWDSGWKCINSDHTALACSRPTHIHYPLLLSGNERLEAGGHPKAQFVEEGRLWLSVQLDLYPRLIGRLIYSKAREQPAMLDTSESSTKWTHPHEQTRPLPMALKHYAAKVWAKYWSRTIYMWEPTCATYDKAVKEKKILCHIKLGHNLPVAVTFKVCQLCF